MQSAIGARIVLGLGAALVLLGCERSTPPAPALSYPSAFAHWPGADGYVVGSYGESALHFVDAAGHGSHPWAGRSGGGEQVLRLALDEPRGLLWVAGEQALHAYRLPLGRNPPRRLASVPVPFSRTHARHCLPDLAVGRDGTVYATSTHSPTLAVVRPDAFTAEVIQLSFPVAGRPPWSLSALAFTPDQRHLMAADAATGTLWRIDPRTFVADEVGGAGDLAGACGMAWLGPRTLAIARGFEKGVSVLKLSAGYRQVTSPAQRCLEDAFVFSMLARDGALVFVMPAAYGKFARFHLRRSKCGHSKH